MNKHTICEVVISKEEIAFRRTYPLYPGNWRETIRWYKATPDRVWRILQLTEEWIPYSVHWKKLTDCWRNNE